MQKGDMLYLNFIYIVT